MQVYKLSTFTMQQDFKGGIYWDDLAKTCDNILRAVKFQENEVAGNFHRERFHHLHALISPMCKE